MIRSLRLACLLAALVTLFMVTPPATRVAHAGAACRCWGFDYAYDYVP